MRRALDELPDTLDGTYERTLRNFDEVVWQVVHRLLQIVAMASRPLRIEELAQVVGFDFDPEPIPKFHEDWLLEDPVDAVLSTTSGLLAIVDVDGSPVIQFAHFSVKEFLMSSRLSESSDDHLRRYHVSMISAHTLAAQACLSILLHLNKTILRDDLDKFPLAEYAAEHWADHARFEDVSRKVEDGMKHLFNPKQFHFTIWVWIHDLEDPHRRREVRSERPLQPRGTPLHYAALCGLGAIARFLVIEHSQDVNSRGSNSSTPLHLAARMGHAEIARFLLDNGADVEARNKRKSTPFHLASRWGHMDVARVLLAHGADRTVEDEDHFNPLKLAIFGGHKEIIKVYLEFPVAEAVDDTSVFTPLSQALYQANIEGARILLARHTGLPTEARGWVMAIKQASVTPNGANVEAFQLLLEYGVDVTIQDDDGANALHMATNGGNVDLMRFLLDQGMDATAKLNNGTCPLHLASTSGHVEIVRLLLERGVDATVREEIGMNSLHLASFWGHMEIVCLLLERGVDVNAQEKDGLTPLYLASFQGHVDIVRLLLKHGADPTLKRGDGWTLLHAVARKAHVGVARLLFELGADTAAQADDGRTPLHVAAANGHVELVRLLLEHEADTTIQSHDGSTALDLAMRGEHEEVVSILLDHVRYEHSRAKLFYRTWQDVSFLKVFLSSFIKYGAD
jgi:ankyrin repeat protein